MNKITRPNDLAMPKVTTGSISASRKVYTSPDGRPDIAVPLREIALTDPEMPTFRVYDSSGPYTDDRVDIDVAKGLSPVRADWIAKRDVEAYDGREVRPEDNGNVAGAHAARVFPVQPKPLRASPSPRSRGEGRGEGR